MYAGEDNPFDPSSPSANRISAAVGLTTPVQLGNLRVQVNTAGTAVEFATVSGTMSGAGRGMAVVAPSTVNAFHNGALALTTTFASAITIPGLASSQLSEFHIRDAGNNVLYRVTVSTAGSGTNNIITIERLHG